MTLTYRWSLLSKPSGSTAMLSLPTSDLPYFTPDVVGKYVVQLIVNDGSQDSRPATLLISTNNSYPVVDPGPGQTVAISPIYPAWLRRAARRRRRSSLFEKLLT